LPSNPGRALLLFFPTPFRLSLFRSLRIAILSDRFFCFAAIEFTTCSFRSSLDGETQSVKSITQHGKHEREMPSDTHQVFLLLPFSFSFLLIAFFNFPSSSLTLTPSILASAFTHFSFSSIAFRVSSGNAANFSFRAVSWSKACDGFDETLSCCTFFPKVDEDPARAENAIFVWEVGFDVDGWSGTKSCACEKKNRKCN
jgi:hypothetical protein